MIKYFYIAVASLLSLFYGLTLSPTVPGGDSGELITVAHSLGVAHPPGYPLYTLVAHLFSYLPFGSVAYRINLFSAFVSVLGGLLLFHLLWKWLKDEWVALVVSLFFFLSPLVWRYSVVAEVFSLNNFFILLLLIGFYRFLQKPSDKALWWIAATFGLACSHHHTILFLALPLFLWLCVYHFKAIFRWKALLPSVGLFVLGFIPYLYIPYAASKKYIFSWGEAEHWRGFWIHFLRQEYGTFQLASGEDESNFLTSLSKYAEDLSHQTLYIALIPVFLGVFFLVKRQKKSESREFLWAIGFSYVFYILVFHYLANMDLSNRLFFDIQSRFWMLPNLLLCFFMAFGLVQWKKSQRSLLRWAPLALMLIYFPLQISMSYEYEDYSKNKIFEDVGRSTLLSLPPKAVMLMRGDIYVNSVRYLQEVEGIRTDVRAIPLDLMWWPWMKSIIQSNYPDVRLPAGVYRYEKESLQTFNLSEFFEANKDKPLFIGKLRPDELKVLGDKYNLLNLGFINAVLPQGSELPFETYRSLVKAFDDMDPPLRSEIRDRSWEAFVYYNYWDREVHRIQDLFTRASKANFPEQEIAYGAERLELFLQRHHEPPAHIYKNLGVAYQFLGKIHPEYNLKMLMAWQNYLRQPESHKDVDRAKIENILRLNSGLLNLPLRDIATEVKTQ